METHLVIRSEELKLQGMELRAAGPLGLLREVGGTGAQGMSQEAPSSPGREAACPVW